MPIKVQQLVHRLHGARHGVLAIFDKVTNPAAIDAALGVRFVEHHPDGVGIVDALHRRDARQIGDRADDDLRGGDTLCRARSRTL
jgi:hypothetical protein